MTVDIRQDIVFKYVFRLPWTMQTGAGGLDREIAAEIDAVGGRVILHGAVFHGRMKHRMSGDVFKTDSAGAVSKLEEIVQGWNGNRQAEVERKVSCPEAILLEIGKIEGVTAKHSVRGRKRRKKRSFRNMKLFVNMGRDIERNAPVRDIQ